MWRKNPSTLDQAARPELRASKRSAVAACILTAALLLFAEPSTAQIAGCVPGLDFGVAPALLSDTEGERRLGVELSASGCSSGHDLRRVEGGGRGSVEFTPPKPFPYSWTLGLDGRFSLVKDGDVVPLDNHVAGRAGISVSLSKPAEPVDCEALDLTDEECAQRAANVGATEFDWGFLALSFRAEYESSLGFSEQKLAGGLELRYAQLRGYIPSIVVSYDAVKPLSSDVRHAVGADDDFYWRWMLQGYVYHQVGRVMGELEAATYRANGLASVLDALGRKDGRYLVGTLSLLPEWKVVGTLNVGRIYVRYSDGRMPSLTDGGRSYGVGVELEL